MSFGFNWLNQHFNVTPRVAWQIDPFGHDIRMVQICSEFGFDALFINRVNMRIKQRMRQDKALEFIWKNGEYEIFTHTLYEHYSAPRSFDFEQGARSVNENSLGSRSNQLINHINHLSSDHRTNHIFIPAGDDFKYRNANRQFENWDKLIKFINEKHGDKIHIRYGSMEEYVDSIFKYSHENEVKFPVVKHDFFTYMDNVDAWWSGYFTTWPSLKRKIRVSEEFLHSAHFLYSIGTNIFPSRLESYDFFQHLFEKLQNAEIEMSVAQHHDYITGTSPRKSINDYFKRVEKSIKLSREIEKEMLHYILSIDDSLYDKDVSSLVEVKDFIFNEYKEYSLIISNPGKKRDVVVEFRSISRNIDIVSDLNQNKHIPYQTVPWIIDPNGNSIKKEIIYYHIYFRFFAPDLSIIKLNIKVIEETDDLDEEVLGEHFLYSTENIDFSPNLKLDELKINILDKFNEEVISLENFKYIIFFSEKTGYILRVYDKINDKIHLFNENMFKVFRTSGSGAYIFRPKGECENFDNKLRQIFITEGEIFGEVYVVTDRLEYSIRLYHLYEDDDISSFLLNEYIHFKYNIHQLSGNTELVLQLMTNKENLKKSSLITYDGLNFIPRDIEIDFGRHPIAGRFYPSTSGAIFRNINGQIEVLTKNAMGVSGKKNILQFLLHRRLSRDDGRGMGQANNDDKPLRCEISFKFDKYEYGYEQLENFEMSSINFNRPVSIYATKKPKDYLSFFTLAKELDNNIEIVHLKENIDNDKLVLRVRNFGFSSSITFKPSDLLKYIYLSDEKRKSLNYFYDLSKNGINSKRKCKIYEENRGNQIAFDIKSGNVKVISTIEEENNVKGIPLFTNNVYESGDKFVIKPREIKTFVMYIKFSKNLTITKIENKEIEEIFIEHLEKNKVEEKEYEKNEETTRIPPSSGKIEFETTSGVLDPRRSLVVYIFFLIATVLILYFIFTASRKKSPKKIQKKKFVPFRGVAMKK